jgi:hypothetical protein
VGKWRGAFNDVDIRLAEESGCKIEKVGRVAVFTEFDDLAGYASDIYEKRRKAGTPAERYILKILLNSLYGKFGENPAKEKLFINPDSKWLRKQAPDSLRMIAPGIFMQAAIIPVPHEHVAIAANITAIARRSLYRFLTQCRELYYCDTDGFCCAPQTFPVSDALGALKHVKGFQPWQDGAGNEHPGAMFLAPKLYSLHDGENLDIKAKGFSRVKDGDKTRPMNYAEFVALLDHAEVPLERFARLKSVARDGLRPSLFAATKTWRGKVKPKRARAGPAGDTRPWDVSELA